VSRGGSFCSNRGGFHLLRAGAADPHRQRREQHERGRTKRRRHFAMKLLIILTDHVVRR
jgi:hypothetical protein